MTSLSQAFPQTHTSGTIVTTAASKSIPIPEIATARTIGLLTRIRRFGTRHETMVAGLGDSWLLFKRVAGDLPVPFLSAALEGVSFVEEKFSLNRKNAKDLKDLKEKLNRFVSTVNHYQGEDAVKVQLRDNECRRCSGVMNILGNKLEALANKYKQDSTPSALIKSSKYANDLAGIVADMNDMVSGMMLHSVLASEENTMKIRAKQLLDDLPRSQTAESDKAVKKTCHPDIRTKVISKIAEWVNGSDARRMFWLNGPPASGKTSIIADVIKRIESAESSPTRKVVVVDFLCTRVLIESGNANVIIPTLAYQLAGKDSAYRRNLLHYLELISASGQSLRSIATDWEPTKQFEELIMKPMASNPVSESKPGGEPKTIVLVVDSLEECAPDQYSYNSIGRNLVTNLLQGLGAGVKQVTNLKIIVSSRPTTVISSQLEGSSGIVVPYDMYQYLNTSDAEDDIQKFYEAELKTIQTQEVSIDGRWPSPDTVLKLVKKTGNSFLIAQTILWNPGHIYTPILDQVVQRLSPGELDPFRKAIMTIILLRRLMSVEDLAAILRLKAFGVQRSLRGVLSIMVVPTPMSHQKSTAVQRVADVIRVHDTAFIDYMREKTIAHPKVWINPTVHNSAMSVYLLRFLNDRLRYISHLSEFDEIHEKTFEVLEYRNNSTQKKLNRVVVYASRFWMYHLSESEMNSNRFLEPREFTEWAKYQVQVVQELKEFLQQGRVLSWVVVLERTGVVEETRIQLRKVKLWLDKFQSTIVIKALKTGEVETTGSTDASGWVWRRNSVLSQKSLSDPRTTVPVVTENVQYDEQDRTKTMKLIEQSLQYLDSEEHKDQLAEVRNARVEAGSVSMAAGEEFKSNWEADSSQGLRQFMSPQYPDEVRKKAKDLFKALGK
ncbi:hypothetical protein J3R30DRAFT_3752220 [Lentinula aciculospora]|uniref:Nephrocystin 3-like N-terminal domain-containing protein n=1 Tax=Lentinula aciculospora TaxID=153920 RepID=A0A9W9DX87_9AGAR|nr:hypothetical protein J3R30DRAFT_3752220 [Lentinula aciculospora]